MPEPIEILQTWYKGRGWQVQPFQTETAHHIFEGRNGMLVAPTGSGKTYALWLPLMANYVHSHPDDYWKVSPKRLQVLWITPIRALAKDIQLAIQTAADEMGLAWNVGVRTGDTDAKTRRAQAIQLPEVLVTTPESLHILLAQKKSKEIFSHVQAIVVDEWHELLGTKRGVQIELALSYLRAVYPKLLVWGISATIANIPTAMEVLLGNSYSKAALVQPDIPKPISITTIFPDTIEKYPWAGHLGIKLLDKVIPLLQKAKTTLIFTNTRAQSEIWYQKMLEADPNLSGLLAMHHGSIAQELREWVEDALHTEKLKAVICTSSLDLGVDFRPVEQIIQIGGPKGVARCIQRAGRSGHRPGEVSKLYFVPTHALELLEAAALKEAIPLKKVEGKEPLYRSFDVLIQYLMTRAVGGGFYPREVWKEIKTTFSYASMNEEEWQWILQFITTGGESLEAYDEYKKVEILSDGLWVVKDRTVATRHRLSMGTIVSDPSMKVALLNGKYLGTVEEWFLARLSPGDNFWFAGRNWEFAYAKDMTAFVRPSKKTTGPIPSWQGGRMPFSSQMSDLLRKQLEHTAISKDLPEELIRLKPILDLQNEISHVPRLNELLVETWTNDEGFHMVFFPIEGRLVHEGLSALIAYRIAKETPLSFTFSMNDYGFELLCDKTFPVDEDRIRNWLSSENLSQEIYASINASEMMRRRFREIAVISGLVFTGYPGKTMKGRHLQANGSLFYEVFQTYDPQNLLVQQAMEEVLQLQLEETRTREALDRISNQTIVLKNLNRPSPFGFPIYVDFIRERLTTESLEDRVKKLVAQWEKE